jgi:hypothetical protein
MAELNVSSTTPKKRGRPPKTKVAEVCSTQSTEVTHELSSYNSRMAYSSYYYGMNIFDYYTAEQLADIVKDPIANNEVLRRISLMLYSSDGIYTNTVDYMTSMPTLNKVIVSHGSNQKKKKKNKEKMTSVLHMIKDREVIRDALFKGMIEGVAFYYFEIKSRPLSAQKFLTDYDVDTIMEINESGINASVISLPVDYTKIVGMKNNSYIIAFNLDYFDDCSGESREKKLRKYPEEIRKAYEKRVNKSTGGNWYVLDNTKTIVHKIRSKRDEKWGRPLVLAAINDILYGDYFTDTKRNVLDEINNRIIYETFPEGEKKGSSALTKTQQQNQHNAVKNAVMNKNNRGGVSFFSVPAGTKIDTIEAKNTDIFDDKYESNLGTKVSRSLGIASSLLDGSGSGNYSSQENNLDLLSSQIYQWIEQIENELNKCISENVIKDNRNWVECKYLPITNVNKKTMVEFAKDLYLQGKGSLSLWASACGISPDIFYALLDQELEEDIEHKYPVHQTSYTLTNNTGGRPVEEDSKNASTLQTRANGSNNTPSPSRQ